MMPGLHAQKGTLVPFRPPPGLRLRLTRQLLAAAEDAYARWPEPVPEWLNEVCTIVEAALERAERLPGGRG